MSGQLPNFLYIGTSKAGSTWIYDILNRHPEVYMAPGKGLYYFSQNYGHGLDWYASQFAGAGDRRVVGEVSHAYLYDENACARIAATAPKMRLMVCLRNPVDRAFSDYLDAVRNGKLDASFEDALTIEPDLFERGRYEKYLSRYLSRFPRQQLHVAIFDDLVEDPNTFAASLFGFLGIEIIQLSTARQQRMLPAGVPRSVRLAQFAKHGAHLMRRLGFRGLRGKLKTSRAVRNLLYRQLADEDRPTMAADTRAELQERYTREIAALDSLLGTSLCERWGYKR